MELIILLGLLWAWDGNLWEQYDSDDVIEEAAPIVVETPVPDTAVDVTQVTQTAAVLTAVAESLTGTSTSTQTEAEIEAQIIEELENMDVTTTTVPTTTTATGTSTSTSTSTGTQ